MGTDIHLHIEIKRVKASKWSTAGICWDGEWGDRYYPMFRRLYGDPDYLDCKDPGGTIVRYVVPYRGFPRDASIDTVEAYGLWVVDSSPSGREITRDEAEKEVNNPECRSQWIENVNIKEKSYISDPDWHTPNWITFDELEKAMLDLTDDIENWRDIFFEWYVLYKTVKLYAKNPELEVRVVYWFDN